MFSFGVERTSRMRRSTWQEMSGQETSRRTILRAAAGTTAALGAAGAVTALTAGAASAAPLRGGKLPYPAGVTDTSHATREVAQIFRGFYTAKSEHNAARLMTYFSKTNAYYIDASSGGIWPSWDVLNSFFSGYFATNPPADAISYPLRIVGDTHSALVEFEDVPQLFGSELRILGSVTFDRHNKIIRWIDYWDGRSALLQNSITSSYPTDLRDAEQNAAPEVVAVAQALQAAFAAGDAAAAVSLFSFDAVHEDMAAHCRLRGQLQIQRYYTRALGQLPYGPGAALAHVEGSRQGGGYEWTAAPVASPMRRGHTCIELDETGKISRLTAIYDSSLLSYSAYTSLVGLAAEAPLS
jgi:hypothetical protein